MRARAQQHVHRGNLLIVAIVVCALGPHVGPSARPPPATVPNTPRTVRCARDPALRPRYCAVQSTMCPPRIFPLRHSTHPAPPDKTHFFFPLQLPPTPSTLFFSLCSFLLPPPPAAARARAHIPPEVALEVRCKSEKPSLLGGAGMRPCFPQNCGGAPDNGLLCKGPRRVVSPRAILRDRRV